MDWQWSLPQKVWGWTICKAKLCLCVSWSQVPSELSTYWCNNPWEESVTLSLYLSVPLPGFGPGWRDRLGSFWFLRSFRGRRRKRRVEVRWGSIRPSRTKTSASKVVGLQSRSRSSAHFLKGPPEWTRLRDPSPPQEGCLPPSLACDAVRSRSRGGTRRGETERWWVPGSALRGVGALGGGARTFLPTPPPPSLRRRGLARRGCRGGEERQSGSRGRMGQDAQ